MKQRRISRIFYISDLHLYDQNLIKPERPVRRDFTTIEDMHRLIAERWKEKVSSRDKVYVLGDVSKRHAHDSASFLKALPGEKILITGNHDLRNLEFREFRSVFSGIHIYQKILDQGREVILFHYPVEEWERYWAGSCHIHGHVHRNQDHIQVIRNRYNASVEENGYCPVTLSEMIKRREEDSGYVSKAAV